MPLFTVIIPTYNRLKLLKESLQSIYTQTFTDYEIIVIDDGSTDGTLEYLQTLAPRIQIYRQENKGPGAARNLGAIHAQGDYLAFLDSDDLWFPWTLASYHKAITAAGEPDFIAGKHYRFSDPASIPYTPPKSVSYNTFKNYLDSYNKWRWLGVSSFVIKREAFLKTTGFIAEKINSEDADIALKLGMANGFLEITEPYTFAYRKHDSNITANLDKTIQGVQYILQSAQDGRYPSDAAQTKSQGIIITRHIRPVSIECIRNNRFRDGWSLYTATLPMHLRQNRWRYIIGFPLIDLITRAKNLLRKAVISF